MSMTMLEMEREILRLKALETPAYSGVLTWTPAFSSSGAAFAYSAQVGRYLAIGRLCVVEITLILNGAPSGTTSNDVTVNLPVTSANTTGQKYPFRIAASNVAYSAGYSGLFGHLLANSSTLTLAEQGGGKSIQGVKASALGAGAEINITGTYITV